MSKKKESKVKLSPPWDGYMNMLASFFKGDDRVRVGCGTVNRVGTIEVFDTRMYAALSQVLNTRLRFGNVVLRIDLVPANGVKAPKGEMTDVAALKEALKRNPAFSRFVTRRSQAVDSVYCLFKPVVLMWYNDNLASPWKQSASLHEATAVHVFNDCGVSFATEPPKGAK